MCNEEVREEIKDAGLFQYEIADHMGMCEMTLIRHMRKPLSQKETAEIREAIKKISAEHSLNNQNAGV
jgi:hypothetical protein